MSSQQELMRGRLYSLTKFVTIRALAAVAPAYIVVNAPSCFVVFVLGK